MQAVPGKDDGGEKESEVGQGEFEETGGTAPGGQALGMQDKGNDEQIGGMGGGGESMREAQEKGKHKQKQGEVERRVHACQKEPKACTGRKGKGKES